jgi:Ca-activated chloride channel family protein
VTFGAPLAFSALVLVPLVAWLLARAERRRTARLEAAGELALLDALLDVDGEAERRRRRAVDRLLLGALTLVILALARPQLGVRTEVQKARGMDVVVALDLSRSMLARDVAPSRLERARLELQALVEGLPGDRVGLVGFTSVAVPLCPLTVDHAAVELQLSQAGPDALPRGGTAIADAIDVAREMLSRSPYTESGKAIVVVTDGEEHEGDPEGAARRAQEAGVVVHVVGVGSAAGEPIPLEDGSYLRDATGGTVVSRLDRARLEQVARAGGGVLAAPSEGFDLEPVRAALSTLGKADLETRARQVHEERYRWALTPALLLLVLATARGRPRRRAPGGGLAGAGLVASLVLAAVLAAPAHAAPWRRVHPDVEAGNAALAAGKPKEALEAYARAEKALGASPELRLDQGLASAAAGDAESAERFLRDATASGDPKLRADASFALGNLARARQAYDDAIGAYRKSLLDDPTHAGARRNLELTRALKRIAASEKQRPQDQQTQKPPESSDGGTSPDATTGDGGPSDGAPSDGGDENRGSGDGDAGVEDSGGSSGGADGGGSADASQSGEQRPDAGGGGADGGATQGAPPPDPNPSTPPEREPPKDKERILDALEAREKALKAERRAKKLPPKAVVKDW